MLMKEPEELPSIGRKFFDLRAAALSDNLGNAY